MKDKEITYEILIGAMIGMVAAAAVIALHIAWAGAWMGYTLSVLWGWFVVPMFGLPQLSIAAAYGIILIARAVQKMPSVEKDKVNLGKKLAEDFIRAPLICGLFLLIGWITKAYV